MLFSVVQTTRLHITVPELISAVQSGIRQFVETRDFITNYTKSITINNLATLTFDQTTRLTIKA